MPYTLPLLRWGSGAVGTSGTRPQGGGSRRFRLNGQFPAVAAPGPASASDGVGGDGGHRRRWLDWIKVFPRGYTPSIGRWSYDREQGTAETRSFQVSGSWEVTGGPHLPAAPELRGLPRLTTGAIVLDVRRPVAAGALGGRRS
jgi:hypothetical protein